GAAAVVRHVVAALPPEPRDELVVEVQALAAHFPEDRRRVAFDVRRQHACRGARGAPGRLAGIDESDTGAGCSQFPRRCGAKDAGADDDDGLRHAVTGTTAAGPCGPEHLPVRILSDEAGGTMSSLSSPVEGCAGRAAFHDGLLVPWKRDDLH